MLLELDQIARSSGAIKIEDVQLDLPLEWSNESLETPRRKLANRVGVIIDCNALDRDTFRVLQEFLTRLYHLEVSYREAKDCTLGRESVGQLPPGTPCIMQPYRGLRFDAEGRMYIKRIV